MTDPSTPTTHRSSSSAPRTSRRAAPATGLALALLAGLCAGARGQQPDAEPQLRFVDVTASSGVAMTLENGAVGEKLLPETMGGGVAFLDHDLDGDPDLFVVGGRRWPWDESAPEPAPSSLALFENDGAGAFTDATVQAGVARSLYGMGPAVGDVDGDGDDDLYVTAVGPNVMFRNEGGFFTDASVSSGTAGGDDDWSTAAGFLDHDGDGDLDLLVGNYVRWSRADDLAGDRRLPGIPGRAYAPPMAFEGSLPLLFVNRGDGTFDEGAEAAGLHVRDDDGVPVTKALALLFTDLDDDADTDVFVANDTTRNLMFVNQGDGTFVEQGTELGLAYDRLGNPTGAMGTDGGAFDDPGLDDALVLFVGNFADEMSSAYVTSRQDPFFLDETEGLGLGRPTRPVLTFGLLYVDLDLDGRRDVLQVNGHLEPAIDGVTGGQTYAQAPQVFLDRGPGATPRLSAVATAALGDLAAPVPGRGLACADVDGDGDLDLAVTAVASPVRLLRNDQSTGHHHLRVTVRGAPGFPTAVGAEVILSAGGREQRLRVDGTRSYLSQVERTLTFGLGEATTVERLAVRWPGETIWRELPPPATVDTTVVLRQPVDAEQIQATLNRAKAQLETGRTADALRTLVVAVELAPDSAPTWRNLARARLASNDVEGAVSALDRAQALDPEAVSAVYLRAMTRLRVDDPEGALALLEDVVRRDPATAAARFHLAMALQALGRADEARVQLEEAVRLDPAHGAAWFQLAVARRRGKDLDGFRAANREFLRLRGLYGDNYTTALALEACVHTLAEAAGRGVASPSGRVSPGAQAEVTFVADDDGLLGGPRRAAAAAVFDMDGVGRYSLVVVGADGALERLDPAADGGLVATPLGVTVSDPASVTDVLVGNVHDDAPGPLAPGTIPPRRMDLFVVSTSGGRLLEQQRDGSFVDVTGRAGLEGAAGRAALLVDHEHDGDLDLAVVGAGGLGLYVNGSDGRFEPSVELPAVTSPLNDLVAVDLTENGAVDLTLAGDAATLRIENRRAGRFVRVPDPPGDWPGATRVLADDVDADGLADVVLIDDAGVRFVFDGVPGRVQPVPGLAVRSAALVDPDGDGWLDLALGGAGPDGAGRLVLLRNGGRGPWPDVTASLGLDALPALASVEHVLAADLDDDGDSDLLLRDADQRLTALRNDGGEAGGLLKLRLLSLVSTSGGLGTRVEIRRDGFFASRTVQREWPVEIGLGGRGELDSVLAVWPYGVIDARTDVSVGDEPLSIVVVERADTGSCPFLYIDDGEGMRFVGDLVGSGATDLPLARGVTNPVNPHEVVVVGPADEFPAVDGALRVSLTSELRESAYFDEVELLAVDHPPGTEVAGNHRLRPPPFPDHDLLCLAGRVPLRAALGDDGVDRTAALAEQDGVHAEPGVLLPAPVRGQCEPYALELDFGPLDTEAPLVLALTGWIEFGTASTFIASSQKRDLVVSWPALEARDGRGVWRPLDVLVGLPGGKRRTVTVELGGRLPEGADRLRLTTTFELHWDRAALFTRVPLAAGAVHAARPASAELGWRGFSDLRVRAPTQPKLPDYDRVSQTPPWRVGLQGWCTRYGDVLPLMAAEDGRLVVLNSGDELRLTVPVEQLPAVPDGMRRTYLWRSVGYNKEADPNNAGVGDVWPLGPDISYGRTPEQDDAWRIEWNTRWVGPDAFHPAQAARREAASVGRPRAVWGPAPASPATDAGGAGGTGIGASATGGEGR